MHMWNLQNKINNNKSGNKLIDTANVLRDTRWEGLWGIAKNGKVIKRYKLIVAE